MLFCFSFYIWWWFFSASKQTLQFHVFLLEIRIFKHAILKVRHFVDYIKIDYKEIDWDSNTGGSISDTNSIYFVLNARHIETYEWGWTIASFNCFSYWTKDTECVKSGIRIRDRARIHESKRKMEKLYQSIGYFQNSSKGGNNRICLIVLNALPHLPRNRMNVNRCFHIKWSIDSYANRWCFEWYELDYYYMR